MLGLYNCCGLRAGSNLKYYVAMKITLRIQKADIACNEATKTRRKAFTKDRSSHYLETLGNNILVWVCNNSVLFQALQFHLV